MPEVCILSIAARLLLERYLKPRDSDSMAALAPVPQPIGVFSQFFANGPETLVLKEKVLSLTGDSFSSALLAILPGHDQRLTVYSQACQWHTYLAGRGQGDVHFGTKESHGHARQSSVQHH